MLPPPPSLPTAVIGAGVVGLAVARALARAGHEVVVLEAEAALGLHTSGRNSEVLHAGLYYAPGSRKARLCVEGRRRLVAYCRERGVPHAILGKLVVATSAGEVGELARIEERARACGVLDLRRLDGAEARALEPALRCEAALHSPSTGVIDSHALLQALLADAQAAGAALLLGAPVRGGVALRDAIELELGGREAGRHRFRAVVNAAGLHAQALSRRVEGLAPSSIPPCHYARGHYATLAGPAPASRLVYPVPEPGGLGVHLTLDLAGRARFGPDVEWVDAVDYRFDERRIAAFYSAVRRYWPALPDGALQPGYAGIRPRLAPANAPAADFAVHGEEQHGVRGLVALYGIESPGLTASLALADEVTGLLQP